MLAIELVRDRKTREPDADTTAAVFEACREHGLILSKSGPYRSVLRMVPRCACHGEMSIPSFPGSMPPSDPWNEIVSALLAMRQHPFLDTSKLDARQIDLAFCRQEQRPARAVSAYVVPIPAGLEGRRGRAK